jgi:Flp pilus assembly protein TadG
MLVLRKLQADERGVAIVEMAFALPILVVMIYMIAQLGMIYRASAGIQQALGEGARYATLCVNPTATGCNIPSPSDISTKINASVYGIGPGSFNVATPKCTEDTTNGGAYYDLSVTYTQATSLLLAPGPNISISRGKRVWVATSKCP